MSTTKHAAEPWAIDQGFGANAIVSKSLTGRPSIIARFEKALGWKPEDDANAARAVACVNACAPGGPVMRALAGIHAALEKRDPGEMHAALIEAAADANETLRALGG